MFFVSETSVNVGIMGQDEYVFCVKSVPSVYKKSGHTFLMLAVLLQCLTMAMAV